MGTPLYVFVWFSGWNLHFWGIFLWLSSCFSGFWMHGFPHAFCTRWCCPSYKWIIIPWTSSIYHQEQPYWNWTELFTNWTRSRTGAPPCRMFAWLLSILSLTVAWARLGSPNASNSTAPTKLATNGTALKQWNDTRPGSTQGGSNAERYIWLCVCVFVCVWLCVWLCVCGCVCIWHPTNALNRIRVAVTPFLSAEAETRKKIVLD